MEKVANAGHCKREASGSERRPKCDIKSQLSRIINKGKNRNLRVRVRVFVDLRIKHHSNSHNHIWLTSTYVHSYTLAHTYSIPEKKFKKRPKKGGHAWGGEREREENVCLEVTVWGHRKLEIEG